MKARKKSAGTKHRIREENKREERIGLAVVLVILIVIISVSGFFIHSLLSPPSQPEISLPSEPTAAIVDHLSLTHPNQTFIETATNTLKQAGYTVDYYPSEEVTVEFYRNLPTHGYKIVVLRVHSALGEGGEPPVALFTSEIAEKTKYVSEQLTDRLQGVAYSHADWEKGTIYFGIMPGFVRSSMNGRFENTIILMMGCNGLTYADMAEAFVEKGVEACISWSDAVSASHTDKATANLLQHLISESQTIKLAVESTMKEVGVDPVYQSKLVFYPNEAGNYTIKA